MTHPAARAPARAIETAVAERCGSGAQAVEAALSSPMSSHNSLLLRLVGVLCLAMLMATGVGCTSSEEEKLCKDAQWAARGGWAKAHSELGDLKKFLTVFDAWHMARKHPGRRVHEDIHAVRARWKMWDEAKAAASEAEKKAMDDIPSKAMFAARSAGQACEAARMTSPPVEKRGGKNAVEGEADVEPGTWYPPGEVAVGKCLEAAALSEASHEFCKFKQPKDELEELLEKKEYDFF